MTSRIDLFSALIFCLIIGSLPIFAGSLIQIGANPSHHEVSVANQSDLRVLVEKAVKTPSAKTAASGHAVTYIHEATIGNITLFPSLSGIGVNSTDHVFFVFTSGGSLRILNPDGTLGTNNTVLLYDFRGMDIYQDDLYVISGPDGSIQEFPPDLSGQTGHTIGDAGLNEYFDVAVNSSGYFFIADKDNCDLVNPSYGYIGEFATTGTSNGQVQDARGIAVNDSDYIFVSDYVQDRIQVFYPNGTFLSAWGTSGSTEGSLNGPVGLAIDITGNIIVADTLNSRVQIFEPDGTFVETLPDPESSLFSSPKYIAVNSTGYIFVTDSALGQIQIFKPVYRPVAPSLSVAKQTGYGDSAIIILNWSAAANAFNYSLYRSDQPINASNLSNATFITTTPNLNATDVAFSTGNRYYALTATGMAGTSDPSTILVSINITAPAENCPATSSESSSCENTGSGSGNAIPPLGISGYSPVLLLGIFSAACLAVSWRRCNRRLA